MLNYLELSIDFQPFEPFNDIAVAWLSEIGFESFVEENQTLKSYIQEQEFDAHKLQEVLKNFEAEKVQLSHHLVLIPGQNWNEVWEREFPAGFVGEFMHCCSFSFPRGESW